jgi:hypothetical protein
MNICNPGGRPKKTEKVIEIEALARQYAPQAMQALVKIAMNGKSDSALRLQSGSSIGHLAGHPKPFARKNENPNVLYMISD